MATDRLFEFGPYTLDAAEHRLSCDGEAVALPPKAFATLVVLVENAGHVLSKNDLLDAVWPESFVEEASLTVTISTLRKILGERGRGDRYIETVPKRGYRFVAPVRSVAPPAEPDPAQAPASPTATARAPRLRALTLALALAAAALVAAVVVMRPGATSPPHVVQAGTAGDEAREAYVKGRYFWNRRDGEGLFKSMACFKQAIDRDPGYALGYAGLADAYAFDLVRWPEAESLAQRAIELDPTLAEPHATLGFIRMFWQWDWDGAEQELQLAVDRNPGYATAHQWYALLLAARGRGAEARERMALAARLDPVSLPIAADAGQLLYFDRDYDRALDQCRRALELDPRFINAHVYMERIYLQKGMHDEAFAAMLAAAEIGGVSADRRARMRVWYEGRGMGHVLAEHAAELAASPTQFYARAERHARLGEREQALACLERAVDEHNLEVVFVGADPVWDELRSDPRFVEVVRRVGLGQ